MRIEALADQQQGRDCLLRRPGVPAVAPALPIVDARRKAVPVAAVVSETVSIAVSVPAQPKRVVLKSSREGDVLVADVCLWLWLWLWRCLCLCLCLCL